MISKEARCTHPPFFVERISGNQGPILAVSGLLVAVSSAIKISG